MFRSVVVELDMPGDLKQFRLPRGVDRRLRKTGSAGSMTDTARMRGNERTSSWRGRYSLPCVTSRSAGRGWSGVSGVSMGKARPRFLANSASGNASPDKQRQPGITDFQLVLTWAVGSPAPLYRYL